MASILLYYNQGKGNTKTLIHNKGDNNNDDLRNC